MNTEFRSAGWFRTIGRILLRLAVIVMLVWGGIAVFQDRLLYLPTQVSLADVVADAGSFGLVPWPNAGDYRGLMKEPADKARGTVIVLHGNAGHAGHRWAYADALVGLGFRVILAEYPGYGPRQGSVGEGSIVADAAAILALARKAFSGPMILGGESLGAGVAAAVAATTPVELSGLLLITPWDRLEQVARHHYPWLPVGMLLRDRYDSSINLARFPSPVAIVVAAEDRIIPPRFGQALHEAIPGPKRLWVVPSADHNDWMAHVDAAWWRDVTGFLIRDGKV